MISVDQMVERTMTPYQYVHNNPIMFTDPTGMVAEGPTDPPKSEEGTVHIYKFNYGNSSPEFQKYMDSFSQEDFHNIRTGIYESSMEKYNTGLGRAMYGLDNNGEVNVPEDIKTRNWNQSGDALYGAMKDAWTSKTTGIDPSSVSMLNPVTYANWQSTRALAVTSNDEALGMIYQTGVDVALAYTAAPIGSPGKIARHGVGEYFFHTSKPHARLLNQDIAHRSATFFRKEIMLKGKMGIKNSNTIYFNHKIGNRNFSIGVNPWKRTIFHEAPGVFK